MRKFVFSMQALFDVKEAAEKQARADYALAQRILDKAVESLRLCRVCITQEQQTLQTDAEQGIAARDFQSRSAYIKSLTEHAAKLEQELAQARKSAQEKQQALLEYHRDRKALERVRESKRQAFMKEEAVKETKEMDDLLMPRMVGRMKEQGNPA